MIAINKRLWILIAVAAASFAAINFAKRGDKEQDIAEIAVRKDRPTQKTAKSRAASVGVPLTESLQRNKMLVPQKLPNLFAEKNWAPPPVITKPVNLVALPPLITPPPVPTAPPEPQAPEFGYAYMGKVQEAAGKPLVFLIKNDRLYEAAPGDVLEATFRIDSIEGGKMVVTYLPLNKQQTIRIGDS
jgi:hypothetical protein